MNTSYILSNKPHIIEFLADRNINIRKVSEVLQALAS